MKPDVENIYQNIRTESDPIEKSKLLTILHSDKEITITSIAQELGYTIAHVSNLLRLSRLPDLILDGYYSGLVQYTHLLLLSRLKSQKDMIEAYELTLQQSFTTAMLEDYIREKLHNIETFPDKVDSQTKDAIRNFFSTLDPSAKIKLVQTRLRTKITITYEGNTKKTTSILEKLCSQLNNATERKDS